MNIDSAFPGKYLKAADLQGRSFAVAIADCQLAEIDQGETKPVLFFAGADRGLVLNRTNAGVIADAYGVETDDWRGRTIELYPTRVPFGSRMVDAIRVRIPGPAAGTGASIPSGMSAEHAASMAAQAPMPAPEAGRVPEPLTPAPASNPDALPF